MDEAEDFFISNDTQVDMMDEEEMYEDKEEDYGAQEDYDAEKDQDEDGDYTEYDNEGVLWCKPPAGEPRTPPLPNCGVYELTLSLLCRLILACVASAINSKLLKCSFGGLFSCGLVLFLGKTM